MKIDVKYFAVYQDLLGKEEEQIDAESSMTVRTLFDQIMDAHPMKEDCFKSTLFAVNQEYVSADHLLQDGDEVAFIPPVAGG